MKRFLQQDVIKISALFMLILVLINMNSDWSEWSVAKLTTVISLATLALNAYQYVGIKKAEQDQHNFDNYYALLHRLIGEALDDEKIRLDCQIAIVYELRHFPKYYPVTLRILEGLHRSWSATAEKRLAHARLLAEIEQTITYINAQ